MRIGNRQFPYPVINNDTNLSKFKTSNFSLNCELKEEINSLLIENVHYESDNETLQELIYDNRVSVAMIVECSSTVYREKFKISDTPQNISIPIHLLNNKVVISAYAYANELIEDFKDSDFLEDYEEYSFTIEPYDIIAIDDGYTTKISYQEDDDNKLSSIFLVVKDFVNKDDKIRVDQTNRKINLNVPERLFDIYDNLKKNSQFQNIFYSLLIIPALTKVINELQSIQFDEISLNYSWFTSIEQAYKNLYNHDLTEEEFQKLDSLEFSQSIMNSPVSKGFDDLYTLLTTGNLEEEEYEQD